MSVDKKTYVIRGYSPHKEAWYYPTSCTIARKAAKRFAAFPNWTQDINVSYKYDSIEHAWEDIWMMQRLAEASGKINRSTEDRKLNSMMFLHSLVVAENTLQPKTYWWMKPND